MKGVVAHYNAEELLSKRANVSAKIREELLLRAQKFNLILDDVSITHLTFGSEFAKAIEHKQVAQQEAETQAYLVAKADQERKASIILAEGILYRHMSLCILLVVSVYIYHYNWSVIVRLGLNMLSMFRELFNSCEILMNRVVFM